jgi:hypothetical protein
VNLWIWEPIEAEVTLYRLFLGRRVAVIFERVGGISPLSSQRLREVTE